MTKPIINIDDLDYADWGNGDRFEARLGAIGTRIGARNLGYNLTILAPGKSAFPFHSHRANEEMFFILEGEGEVRLGEGRFQVRGGDVIACPPGGPETAHQLINSSDSEELKFLAVSTQLSPEVAEYPDSNKTGVMSQLPPGPDGQPRVLRFVVQEDTGFADYWDDE